MRAIYFFFYFLLMGFSLYGKTQETVDLRDQYLWLEEVNSLQTLQWLDEQESICESYFQKLNDREKIQNQLMKILEFDFVDVPQKRGDKYFFISRKKGQNQASLYMQISQEEPRLIIDPTTFSEDGTTCLVDFLISPDGSLAAYGLSKSGSDWQEWNIRDIETGQDLIDHLHGVRFSSPAWDEDGKGLYYFSFKNGDLEHSYALNSSLYYHRLGTSSDQDFTIYNTPSPGRLCYSLSVMKNHLLFCFTKGSNYHNGVMYKNLHEESADFIELLPNGNAKYDYLGCREERLFFMTNDSAPKGRIISIDPRHSEESDWIEHLAENDEYMEQACFAGDKLVVCYLEDVCSHIKICDMSGQILHYLSLPGFNTIGSLWKNRYLKESHEDPEFFYTCTHFTLPVTVYRCHADTCVSEVFASPGMPWTQDYEVKQIYYPSKDSTLIPMFIVHKKGLQLDGNRPTLLFGYGGFGIPVMPSFNAKNIAWMDMGGIYASANIRGGGEYGEEWHRAGMQENKQTVFDDFIAAAEWLIAKNYCTPSKLAITGRSNGGLLVGACLVQRPELFRAAVIGVGVLDMLRFHRFTIGWAWTIEYGSPDNPMDFPILYAYSPYHQIKEDAIYPSTLITTADHDNRVAPIHSYKFAAALQAVQELPNPILLRVYKKRGHGSGKTVDQRIEEDVDFLSFLVEELKIETVFD